MKRIKFYLGILLGVSLVAILLNVLDSNAKSKGGNNDIKISIITDMHYFSEYLYSDCDDFEYTSVSERKLLLESDAILNVALEQIIKDKPDVVLVGGDMVKEGEMINHKLVVEKLKLAKLKLKNLGVDTEFLVINGNHDINADAKDFSSGKAEPIHSVTTAEFKELYKEFGYGKDSDFYTTKDNVGGGLSYAKDLNNGYTLIAVDTCKYTKDQTKTGLDKAETGGMISDDLLKWIKNKAKEAYKKGNIPIVLQHHGVMPHFEGQEVILSDYVVDDYKKVGQTYVDAGIKLVFSGHSHASDIAYYKNNEGKEVYDIATSSITGYPLSTRNVKLSKKDGKLHFDTSVELLREVKFNDLKIDDIQEYAFNKHFSKEGIKIFLSKDSVEYCAQFIKRRGGIKGILADTLEVNKDDVTYEIVNKIIQKLPISEENSLSITIMKNDFAVYYNNEKEAIYIKQRNDDEKSAIELYVPKENLIKLIEELLIDIETNIINNTEGVYKVWKVIVDNVYDYKIYNNKSLGTYILDAYVSYITGNSNLPQEKEEIMLMSKNKEYIENFINDAIYKDTKKEMVELLSLIDIDIKDLIVVENETFLTNSIINALNILVDDVGDIWKIIAKKCLLSKGTVEYANVYITSLLDNLISDDNIKEDNNFKCTINIE